MRCSAITLGEKIDQHPDLGRQMTVVRIKRIDAIGLALERLKQALHLPGADRSAGDLAAWVNVHTLRRNAPPIAASLGTYADHRKYNAATIKAATAAASMPLAMMGEAAASSADELPAGKISTED